VSQNISASKKEAMSRIHKHTKSGRRNGRQGLTLVELLVVLAIMGLIASSLTVSSSFAMEQARQRNVHDRMFHSWKLARVLARTQQEPMIWELKGAPSGVTASVFNAAGQLQREFQFEKWNVVADHGPVALGSGPWRIRIDSSGLSDSVSFQLVQEGRSLSIDLPATVESAIPSPQRKN
jgi:prepilin-type N-terminal cleavage/methylation domain-containing protein